MIVTNFSLIDFENGNTLQEAELDFLFNGIHSTIEGVLFNAARMPLMPDSFIGENKIAATINNSLFSIDADGDIVLVSKQSFDDSVADAAASAAAAAVSAESALSSALATATSATPLTVAQASQSLILAQAGKPFANGMYVSIVDTNNPTTRWMLGAITAFNASTGAMTVSVTALSGSGSASSWAVSASAPINLQGALSIPLIDNTGTLNISAGGHYILIYAAGVTTATLPPSPSIGDEFVIDNATGRYDVVLACSGKNIMGLAENLTFNKQGAVKLRYVDATRGWRFV